MNLIESLNPQNRVGIITGIRPNPYDTDFRNITILTTKSDKKRGKSEQHITEKVVTARQASEKRLLAESFVVWGLLSGIHRVSEDELQQRHINPQELLRKYKLWVKEEYKHGIKD